MARKESLVKKIVRRAALEFGSFGGGRYSDSNPIARALSDRPPQFAAGVDIEQVVRFVLAKHKSLTREPTIGDDERDYLNSMMFLEELTLGELRAIPSIATAEMRRGLARCLYPFEKLSMKNRDTLCHLPISWIRGAADRLLASREHKASRKNKKEKK